MHVWLPVSSIYGDAPPFTCSVGPYRFVQHARASNILAHVGTDAGYASFLKQVLPELALKKNKRGKLDRKMRTRMSNSVAAPMLLIVSWTPLLGTCGQRRGQSCCRNQGFRCCGWRQMERTKVSCKLRELCDSVSAQNMGLCTSDNWLSNICLHYVHIICICIVY